MLLVNWCYKGIESFVRVRAKFQILSIRDIESWLYVSIFYNTSDITALVMRVKQGWNNQLFWMTFWEHSVFGRSDFVWLVTKTHGKDPSLNSEYKSSGGGKRVSHFLYRENQCFYLACAPIQFAYKINSCRF